MDGKIIMDQTYHQHTDYSIQEIKHHNTCLTISKSLSHPKITQQVGSYIYTKFWEYLQNKAHVPLSFHGDSIMSSLADSCVRRIIKSSVSKTYFNSIIITLMVEMECDSKTLDFIIHLIWLPAQEDFIENKARLRYSP